MKHREMENSYVDFSIDVTYELTKRCDVSTNDYMVENDDFEKEAFINTELTDWETAYKDQHYTITELLRELEKYVNVELSHVEPDSKRRRELNRMLDDLQGWEVVEENYETEL